MIQLPDVCGCSMFVPKEQMDALLAQEQHGNNNYNFDGDGENDGHRGRSTSAATSAGMSTASRFKRKNRAQSVADTAATQALSSRQSVSTAPSPLPAMSDPQLVSDAMLRCIVSWQLQGYSRVVSNSANSKRNSTSGSGSSVYREEPTLGVRAALHHKSKEEPQQSSSSSLWCLHPDGQATATCSQNITRLAAAAVAANRQCRNQYRGRNSSASPQQENVEVELLPHYVLRGQVHPSLAFIQSTVGIVDDEGDSQMIISSLVPGKGMLDSHNGVVDGESSEQRDDVLRCAVKPSGMLESLPEPLNLHLNPDFVRDVHDAPRHRGGTASSSVVTRPSSQREGVVDVREEDTLFQFSTESFGEGRSTVGTASFKQRIAIATSQGTRRSSVSLSGRQYSSLDREDSLQSVPTMTFQEESSVSSATFAPTGDEEDESISLLATLPIKHLAAEIFGVTSPPTSSTPNATNVAPQNSFAPRNTSAIPFKISRADLVDLTSTGRLVTNSAVLPKSFCAALIPLLQEEEWCAFSHANRHVPLSDVGSANGKRKLETFLQRQSDFFASHAFDLTGHNEFGFLYDEKSSNNHGEKGGGAGGGEMQLDGNLNPFSKEIADEVRCADEILLGVPVEMLNSQRSGTKKKIQEEEGVEEEHHHVHHPKQNLLGLLESAAARLRSDSSNNDNDIDEPARLALGDYELPASAMMRRRWRSLQAEAHRIQRWMAKSSQFPLLAIEREAMNQVLLTNSGSNTQARLLYADAALSDCFGFTLPIGIEAPSRPRVSLQQQQSQQQQSPSKLLEHRVFKVLRHSLHTLAFHAVSCCKSYFLTGQDGYHIEKEAPMANSNHSRLLHHDADPITIGQSLHSEDDDDDDDQGHHGDRPNGSWDAVPKHRHFNQLAGKTKEPVTLIFAQLSDFSSLPEVERMLASSTSGGGATAARSTATSSHFGGATTPTTMLGRSPSDAASIASTSIYTESLAATPGGTHDGGPQLRKSEEVALKERFTTQFTLVLRAAKLQSVRNLVITPLVDLVSSPFATLFSSNVVSRIMQLHFTALYQVLEHDWGLEQVFLCAGSSHSWAVTTFNPNLHRLKCGFVLHEKDAKHLALTLASGACRSPHNNHHSSHNKTHCGELCCASVGLVVPSDEWTVLLGRPGGFWSLPHAAAGPLQNKLPLLDTMSTSLAPLSLCRECFNVENLAKIADDSDFSTTGGTDSSREKWVEVEPPLPFERFVGESGAPTAPHEGHFLGGVSSSVAPEGYRRVSV